jgi:DNA-binding XRE family transcriptional regulator
MTLWRRADRLLLFSISLCIVSPTYSLHRSTNGYYNRRLANFYAKVNSTNQWCGGGVVYFRRLRDLREDRDLKQTDVAALLGIRQTVYSRYERGFQNQAEVDEWNTAHGYKDQNGNWQPLQPVAKPGDIRFIDQNGDGMLDTNDRVKVGSGTPKVSLGFNINLAYKDFDLVANFYGDFGAKRYNYTKYQLERMDHVFNYGKNALNAWTPENPDTDIPRAVSGDPNKNSRTSTRFVENGDYLRLNNLQIGYNLPVKYCKKMGLSNLRIYVGATRLFTITNYKGYDPSTGSSVGQMGYDYAAIPLSRDFMMGLKFGF